MNSQNILGVSGSYRSKIFENKFLKTINKISTENELYNIIEKFGRDGIYSNSDLSLMAGLYGSTINGSKIDVANLIKYFQKGKVINEEKLLKKVENASGFLISTPVYFGDRSYLVDEFIRFLKKTKNISNRIFGSLSVGAKRNGGQETTNIFILKELNDHRAFVVGNGPPTSQYGGTSWAGNLGSIKEDNFGIITSMGTGKKISEILKIKNSEISNFKDSKELKISLWLVSDKDDKIENTIDKFVKNIKLKNIKINWDIINFTKFYIEHCKACPICPFYQKKREIYKCKVNDDDFAKNFDRIINTDGIIICALNYDGYKNGKNIYQKILERTRCIRRDNFLLTNIPVTSLSMQDSNINSLFSLKVMTSFLRHNTIIAPPIFTNINHYNNIDNFQDGVKNFIKLSILIKNRKNFVFLNNSTKYIPIGY